MAGLTDKLKQKFVEQIGQGQSVGQVCAELGISVSAYHRERHRDPAFAGSVDEARQHKEAGRPPKLNERRKDAFVTLVEQGNTIASICEGLGIDTSTYRHARRSDPAFADLVDDAKRIRVALVEDALYATAVGGNVTAQIFFLCNRAPQDWKNVQHVRGVVAARTVETLSDDELMAIAAGRAGEVDPL